MSSLPSAPRSGPLSELYEKFSCARGEMGNRIKRQFFLFLLARADSSWRSFVREKVLRGSPRQSLSGIKGGISSRNGRVDRS